MWKNIRNKPTHSVCNIFHSQTITNAEKLLGNKILRNGPVNCIIIQHTDLRIWREVDVIICSQNLLLYLARMLHVPLCSELDCTCTVHKGIEHSAANIYLALRQHTFCGTGWLLYKWRNRNSRNRVSQSENACGLSCGLLAVWCRDDDSSQQKSSVGLHRI
jgi:hypothetical protein